MLNEQQIYKKRMLEEQTRKKKIQEVFKSDEFKHKFKKALDWV